MNYEIEKETIKKVHITNQGFIWYYEICDDPDHPNDNVVVKQVEEDKTLAKITIPKDLISDILESLEEYKEAQ